MAYIDRDKLLKDISEGVVFTVRSGKPSAEIRGANKVIDRIKNAPAADVVEVKHGYWIDNEEDFWVICSACGIEYLDEQMDIIDNFSYCPHCGAKMDGRSEE